MTETDATVLRLITRLNIGGPARQALMLTKDLADEFPTVLGAGTPPPDEGELSDPDVPVVDVPFRRSLSPIADVASYRAVKRLLKGKVLLHTHMAKAGAVGRWAARRMKQPPVAIHTFHGHVLEGYFSPFVERTFIQIERALAKSTDVLIAVSDEVRSSLLELGIGDENKVRVIPLGFDLSPFLGLAGPDGALRARLAIRDGVPLLGVAGRLAPIKDHALLFRALRRVDDAHLVIFGDGDERSRLEDLAATLGLLERVHFYGWCLDIAGCIRDVDVMVISSRNEGTPVSLIEAGAAAIPAVATDVGGVRTVVRDGETGLLVPAGDEGALATALRDLLADGSRRARFGAAAREHVRERFSKERLERDIRGLYRELLGAIAGHE